MTRIELIEKIAQAISRMEGFGKAGSRATLNANPGNIRTWSSASRGGAYPRTKGYVDFVAWARRQYPKTTGINNIQELALVEGWRVLRALVGQYVNGKYTGGKSPTLRQMFHVYAPGADANDPVHYAAFVAARLNVPVDTPLNYLYDIETTK